MWTKMTALAAIALTGGMAMGQTAGHRTYYNADDVDLAQSRQGTTVYTTEKPSDVTVRRYYDYDNDGRVDQRSTTYYINDRGERVYYSTGVGPGPEPQGRVHYGSGGMGSAYDVHVHGNREVGRDRTVYVDRDNVTVYGNPAATEHVWVDRYYVAPPTERVIVFQPQRWSGDNLEFRGELVGLNRVWSEAYRGYTTLATVRQPDGRMVDFHVRNWKDLELNNFSLGDTVTIRADARDLNGKNILILDEINRR